MINNIDNNSKFKKISVVIPALNEEGIVGKTVQSIPQAELSELGFEVEVIVVDNASTDNTSQEALEAGARVIYEEKRGYGNAYHCGLREAQGDIIIIGDADGSHPFEVIPQFIAPILEDNYDLVVGSRMNDMMEDEAMPRLHKYVGNPMLTYLLNVLYKTNFTDTHCGMRAFTRDTLQQMDLECTGMEFALEMLIEASQKNFKIEEVPIKVRKRGAGETKLRSFPDGWRHVKFMFGRKIRTKTNYNLPMVLNRNSK